jgi:hypothetical protein
VIWLEVKREGGIDTQDSSLDELTGSGSSLDGKKGESLAEV